jgi:ribosomal protein S18 acetylase RimI-like enzyme
MFKGDRLLTTEPFTFRRATHNDLEAIIALLADDDLGQSRERVSTPVDQAYLSAFDAIQSDSNQLLAILEDNTGVAGCLQISFIPGLSRLGMWRGQIESVRIARRCRGDGLGRAMIEWAIEQCRLKQCGLVQLTSDKARNDALRFYASLGFKASHEGLKLAL